MPIDADHVGVRGVGLGVLLALRLVPLAGVGDRVVAGLEGDVGLARLPFGVLEHEPDRLDHLLGALGGVALHRQVGGDQHVGLALAAVLELGAGVARESLHALVAVIAIAAARGERRGPKRGRRAERP